MGYVSVLRGFMLQEVSDIAIFSATVERLLANFSGKVIYLQGDLGVGKTTFVQHWLRLVGVDDLVVSPTYSIVQHYENNEGKRFLHADLYRLSEPEELFYLDVELWTSWAEVIFIEWPIRGAGVLPCADAVCALSFEGDRRFLDWRLLV